jgi:hypothetical protein
MKLRSLFILIVVALFLVSCGTVAPKPTLQSGDFPKMAKATPDAGILPYDLEDSFGPFIAPEEAAAMQDTVRRLR